MIPISSVMNKDVLIFGRDTTVLAMLDAMHARHMGAAVIVDGEPIGIFTERDVIRCITEHRDAFLTKRAEELMTAPVITISPDENIETASVIMAQNRIRRIPVVADGKLIGIISYRDIANALRKSYFDLEGKNRRLTDQIIHDEMTGLYTRAYVRERLRSHISAAKKTGSPLSVTMLDIDFFKKVNDTYGHQCGDMVLRRVAAIMLERSMGINTVGRYGGEEFIIVGPISDHTSAFQAAEAIRLAVAAERFAWEGKDFSVTISAGVAIWQRDMNSYKELVAAADAALYEAKRTGRDRVVLAPTKSGASGAAHMRLSEEGQSKK